MRKKQQEIYNQMTVTFPPEVIEKWTAMVNKWEDDPTSPNPYEEPQCCMCLIIRSVDLTLFQQRPFRTYALIWRKKMP